MFKSIINLSLLCSSLSGVKGDADGWVNIAPVSKKTYIDTGNNSEDQAKGVIFTKKLGNRTLQVQFPTEPAYRYLSADVLEITATKGNENYQLIISNAISSELVEAQVREVFLQPDIVLAEVNKIDENRWDLHFRKDGKWITKTFLLKENHLCIFHTENVISHRQNGHDFVASLDLKPQQN